MASCTKWILNIHSFTIWIKNEQLPVDHTFWWPILRKKFHEIFTQVWEAISKTRASGFIRRSKYLKTIKALGRSSLVLSSVSRCLEPLIKSSHSLLIYYVKVLATYSEWSIISKEACRNRQSDISETKPARLRTLKDKFLLAFRMGNYNSVTEIYH